MSKTTQNTEAKNVLVIGGAGYIGSHCVRLLIEAGHSPVILDNLVYGHRESRPENVSFYQGDIETCESAMFLDPKIDSFDIIIANITKNILLDSAFKIDQYSQAKSSLILSGFYESDVEDILNKYSEHNFTISSQTSLNKWACLHLIKN